jgi:hypothetical protein
MTTFRLEPIPETKTSHHWRASTIAPMTVWTDAADEEAARRQVTLATIIATRAEPGREMPIEPWMDFGLVRCVLDESRSVPPGTVLKADGQILEIE